MSKRKNRRFDYPRFGVGESAIQEESKELRREMDDYSLPSNNERKEMLDERQKGCRHAVALLNLHMDRLPERERAAFQCIMFRDCLLLLTLYTEFLKGVPKHEAVSVAPAPSPVLAQGDSAEPFTEWLFGKEYCSCQNGTVHCGSFFLSMA
jgi:hypothetical protein